MIKSIPPLLLDDLCRFWSHIERRGLDECWLTDQRSKRTRPQIVLNGKHYLYYRVMYYVHYGIDPGELEVAHSCNNGLNCVNPHHLYLATHKENMNDAHRDGLLYTFTGKLSPEDVAEIRRLYRFGISSPELAKRFNVSRKYIWILIAFKDHKAYIDYRDKLKLERKSKL